MSYNIERVTRQQRAVAVGQGHILQGCTVWLTGLSGSGKSTIAFALEKYIVSQGSPSYCLDADIIRRGLNSNLEYSYAASLENVRRVAEVAKLFADAGMICLAAFISPHKESRDLARKIHDESQLNFIEVYVNTPLAICEARDTKDLYRKARTGEIQNLVGIQIQYDEPKQADVIVNTDTMSVHEAVQAILNKLVEKTVLSRSIGFMIRELFITDDRLDGLLFSHLSENNNLEINENALYSIQLLSEGWATPLSGFMREKEYIEYIHLNVRVAECPVLYCSAEDKKRLSSSQVIPLLYKRQMVALIKNHEFFQTCQPAACVHTSGTNLVTHHRFTDWLIGGDLEVFRRIHINDGLDKWRFTPTELRKYFHNQQSDAVFAFKIHGIMHDGHLLMIQEARRQLLEWGYRKPLLLIHPIAVPQESVDNIPLSILIDQYDICLKNASENEIQQMPSIIAILPPAFSHVDSQTCRWSRHAYALAGINFYVTSDQDSKDLECNLDDIEPLTVEQVAYHRETQKMVRYKPNLHDEYDFISNSTIKHVAMNNRQLPSNFMPIQAWQVLLDYFDKTHRDLK